MPTENRISEGTRCARLTRPERSHDNKAKQSSAKLEKLAEAEVWYHSREQVFERRWGNGRKNLEKPEAQDCPMRISGNQMPTAVTWWRWWWRRWWAVVVVVLVRVASVGGVRDGGGGSGGGGSGQVQAQGFAEGGKQTHLPRKVFARPTGYSMDA